MATVIPVLGGPECVRARVVLNSSSSKGKGTFVIEFGYICYQDMYPDVSCVYPEGYTYPDVS